MNDENYGPILFCSFIETRPETVGKRMAQEGVRGRENTVISWLLLLPVALLEAPLNNGK